MRCIMIGRPPFGTWELALPDTEEVRGLFTESQVEEQLGDILFFIT